MKSQKTVSSSKVGELQQIDQSTIKQTRILFLEVIQEQNQHKMTSKDDLKHFETLLNPFSVQVKMDFGHFLGVLMR